MRKIKYLSVVMTFFFCFSCPVFAKNIDQLTKDASNIIAGKIKKIESFYETNKWGDTLIMSEVKLKVEKTIKGTLQDDVVFTVEGGRIGDVMLRVSNIPFFEEGDGIIVYLKKKDNHFIYLDSEKIDVSMGKAKPSPKLSCCKTFSKWPNPFVSFYVNPNSFDLSQDCITQQIIAAAENWNEKSGINLHYEGISDRATVNSSDENVIFFRDDPSGSTIAVTYIWYTKKNGITAFDMVFYDSWAYFDLSGNCSAGCNTGFYLQTIAAHELGHAIGLDHNRCATSIMYPYASYCDSDILSGEDEACVQSLYGN